MKEQLEKTFEYLRRKDGSNFSPETVENWYKARSYVLEKLKNVVIGPGSNNHLHVVVLGDSPLLLAVVRQVALLAHYANFDDATGCNRTVITIVSENEAVAELLKKEEYLCNLLDYCMHTCHTSIPKKVVSFVDIELNIIRNRDEADTSGIVVEMSMDDINVFLKNSPKEITSIDTRKAVLAGRMYDLGSLIDNLPDEDIHSAKRYTMALDVFQYILLRKPITLLVDEKKWGVDVTRVRNGLSTIFCADCFESRAKGIAQYCDNLNKKTKEAWEENNEALSKSEHARWVVEKLIMGFRALNKQERIEDERLFGDEKNQYRNQLKKRPNDPTHIDICSYADLRRINPNDLKYDSFMVLAIPMILKKLGKE